MWVWEVVSNHILITCNPHTLIAYNKPIIYDHQHIEYNLHTIFALPIYDFKYYFTLFSKFFSSFPHGTCSLSVSWSYLAFDGVHHQLRAAIPNSSTPIVFNAWTILNHIQGFHLLWLDFPAKLYPIPFILKYYTHHNSTRSIQAWAIPYSLAVTKRIIVIFFSSA